MTEEIKADMEDMKDFGHQARLELKMKGRDLKQDLKEKMNEATGSKEDTTKDRAEIKLHNAEDTMKQVGLEVKKKARDAKAAINKSGPKQALDSAAIATGDALVDAKDTVMDAVGPSSVPVDGGVMVEKTSSTGVDISHIEGGGEASIIREQRKAAERAERDAQREREKKRQQLVDDTKAKLHVAKEKTSEVAETVGEKLKDVVDQAGVELGKAAVVLKDKLDDYTDDRPREKVTPKISDNGINISSIQNARNDEIEATQARVREIEKSKEPGSLTKAKEKISQAVDSLKESYHDATHDAPKPIFVHKTSSHGVDISHIESGMNERLAAKEAARLEAEKRAEREHDKAVIQARVVDPLKYDAAETKDGMLDQSDSLKAKMSALGDSISRAAHKLSDKVAESWNELTQKDESSTLDQDQEMRALEREDANIVAPTTSSNPATVGSRQGEPLKDKVIRNTLDAGVALRESLSSASSSSSSSSASMNAAPSSRRDADSNVDLTSKVSAASHELKESASIQADKVVHKASKLKRKAIEKLNQEQGNIPPNPANYVDPHAPVAPSAPVMAASNDPAPGASSLLSALPPVAPSSTTTSNTSQSSLASSSSNTVDAKPDLDRVNTLPVVATASPMTPDTFQTFKANP